MRSVRIGLILAFWLALGATATVGMTWLGIANTLGWGWEPLPEPGPMMGMVDTGTTFPWPHTPPRDWLPQATARWEASSSWSDHTTYLSETGWMYDHRAGLPFRCLNCWETEVFQSGTFVQTESHGSFPVRFRVPIKQFLPYSPLWPGFALNSVIFAAVGYGLSRLSRSLYLRNRHRRRSRAGKCPECNYDRTGLAAGAVCPECGAGGAGGSTPA